MFISPSITNKLQLHLRNDSWFGVKSTKKALSPRGQRPANANLYLQGPGNELALPTVTL